MEIKVIASGSTGNCYVVDDGASKIMLECGIPYKRIQEALDYKVAQTISACFLSHEHGDHAAAIENIIGAGIPCYASRGTWIKRGRTCDNMCHPMFPLTKTNKHTVCVGTFRVMAFDVQHDAAEPVGFLIDSTATGERLLYFTDTYYLRYTFDNITHIVAECNYCADTLQASIDAGETPPELAPRLLKSHMSLEQLIATLKANDLSQLREVHLVHLSKERGDAERMKAEVQKETGVEVYVH